MYKSRNLLFIDGVSKKYLTYIPSDMSLFFLNLKDMQSFFDFNIDASFVALKDFLGVDNTISCKDLDYGIRISDLGQGSGYMPDYVYNKKFNYFVIYNDFLYDKLVVPSEIKGLSLFPDGFWDNVCYGYNDRFVLIELDSSKNYKEFKDFDCVQDVTYNESVFNNLVIAKGLDENLTGYTAHRDEDIFSAAGYIDFNKFVGYYYPPFDANFFAFLLYLRIEVLEDGFFYYRTVEDNHRFGTIRFSKGEILKVYSIRYKDSLSGSHMLNYGTFISSRYSLFRTYTRHYTYNSHLARLSLRIHLQKGKIKITDVLSMKLPPIIRLYCKGVKPFNINQIHFPSYISRLNLMATADDSPKKILVFYSKREDKFFPDDRITFFRRTKFIDVVDNITKKPFVYIDVKNRVEEQLGLSDKLIKKIYYDNINLTVKDNKIKSTEVNLKLKLGKSYQIPFDCMVLIPVSKLPDNVSIDRNCLEIKAYTKGVFTFQLSDETSIIYNVRVNIVDETSNKVV